MALYYVKWDQPVNKVPLIFLFVHFLENRAEFVKKFVVFFGVWAETKICFSELQMSLQHFLSKNCYWFETEKIVNYHEKSPTVN